MFGLFADRNAAELTIRQNTSRATRKHYRPVHVEVREIEE